MVLVGATVAAGLGAAAVHAQTALEDPRNAPKIFANTCSACHKSPQGLAKSGGTASFLRQHYTTGPEMSAAMAAYLAAAGNGPPSKKNDKQKEAPATASRETPGQKRTGHPFTDGSTDVSPRQSAREKQKAPKGEPKQVPSSQTAAHPIEPPPAIVERAVQPAAPAASATAALAPSASDPVMPPAVALDLPPPPYPTEAPADFLQPPVFSSAPLP
jgi:hypothetical protein